MGNREDLLAGAKKCLYEKGYARTTARDIASAADVFAPVHESTGGADGFVSIEVSPLLAADTAGTIAEAKQLHAKLARPNVLIKVPATPEGLPAIEELIAAGVSVNVTLIFSVEVYAQVAEAYLRGLERRLAAGGDILHPGADQTQQIPADDPQGGNFRPSHIGPHATQTLHHALTLIPDRRFRT